MIITSTVCCSHEELLQVVTATYETVVGVPRDGSCQNKLFCKLQAPYLHDCCSHEGAMAREQMTGLQQMSSIVAATQTAWTIGNLLPDADV